MQRLEFVSRVEQAVKEIPLPLKPEPHWLLMTSPTIFHHGRFAALGVPLTFAILPRDKNSKALAEKRTR